MTVRRGERDDDPVELLPFGPADLALVRAVVRRHARAAGLTGDRPECLILAVHEIAAAAAAALGTGSAVLRCTTRAGRVVCEIHTSPEQPRPEQPRPGPSPATAPRDRDNTGPSHSRGLRIARALCDTVETIDAHGGSVVRVTMEQPPPTPPAPSTPDGARG